VMILTSTHDIARGITVGEPGSCSETRGHRGRGLARRPLHDLARSHPWRRFRRGGGSRGPSRRSAERDGCVFRRGSSKSLRLAREPGDIAGSPAADREADRPQARPTAALARQRDLARTIPSAGSCRLIRTEKLPTPPRGQRTKTREPRAGRAGAAAEPAAGPFRLRRSTGFAPSRFSCVSLHAGLEGTCPATSA
jgi:hypothetical protein